MPRVFDNGLSCSVGWILDICAPHTVNENFQLIPSASHVSQSHRLSRYTCASQSSANTQRCCHAEFGCSSSLEIPPVSVALQLPATSVFLNFNPHPQLSNFVALSLGSPSLHCVPRGVRQLYFSLWGRMVLCCQLSNVYFCLFVLVFFFPLFSICSW